MASGSWPSDIPETLWNYRGLQVQDVPQIPMMGVSFTRQFLVAFAVGFLFVAYVAWDRFNTRQTEADGFRYRVMREIEVADLGGAAALRRAYFIYVTTLLFLYVTTTFFGKLFVQTVNALNVVGIQVDASSLQFDSPQWPLTLAFAFAGLAPLIPQLRAAETWLFQRAYRAVGIPVRIHETTRNLLDLLSGGKSDEAPEMAAEVEQRRQELEEKIRGTWIDGLLSVRASKRDHALSVLAQLDVLVELAKGKRGSWPGSDVSDAMLALERDIATQAEDLLDELDKRLREAAPESPADPAEGAAAGGEGAEAPAPNAAGAAERRERYLNDAVARARELRDELAAILAVYVERDPDYVESGSGTMPRDRIRDPGFRRMLEQADPPNLAGAGPELGVLICIGIATLLYALFAWQELHPLLTPRASPESLRVVLATAALETLRLLSLFWFPLLAAFGLRQYYCDEGTWAVRAAGNPSRYAEQRLATLGLAFFVAAVCMTGVAALWSFFIARDVSTFKAILVGGSTPFLLYYPTMAVVTVPLVWLALAGADARAVALALTGDAARLQRRRVLSCGLWCAALVAAVQAGHVAFWYSARPCVAGGTFLLDMFGQGCFVYYGGLDYFVMPALAFLAVVVFGKPHPAPGVRPAHAAAPPSDDGGTARHAAPVPLLACCLLAVFAATPAFGQGDLPAPNEMAAPRAHEPRAQRKQMVRIGFRADAEPFSYMVAEDGGAMPGRRPLYRGYLADLCYWIFDGGDYSVVEVEVTAGDRFDLLEQDRIDVLCDPVTLRYTEKDRRVDAGIFSPIVFATGISYLRRPNRNARMPIFIGYVRQSTARDVAPHACRIDLFNVVPLDQRADLAGMCETAVVARDLVDERRLQLEEGKPRDAPPDSLIVRVEQAAEREVASLERRAAAASAPRKAEFDAPLMRWRDLRDYVAGCRVSKTCDLERIVGMLGGRCDAPAAATPAGEWAATVYRFCPMDDHTALIRWFCERRDGAPGKVYLGDREIILGKLQTWNERKAIRCEVENEAGAPDLTYEPYALMTARPRVHDTMEKALERIEITRLVQRRVYEFFSFGALARAKFDVYFLGPRKDRTMSPALAYLFLLNGVEEERRFVFPAPPVDGD